MKKLISTCNMLLLMLLVMFCNESCKKTDFTGNSSLEAQALSANGKALRHTKQYSSEVATQWFTTLTNVIKAKAYFSPQLLRILTYSGISLYESVVPGMPSYQSIYRLQTGNSIAIDNSKEYYWPACANAAIARISTRLMQDYPAPNLSQVQALEASFNTSFQSQVSPQQLQLSNDFGKQVADIIYEWSKTDGTFNPNGTLAACPPFVLSTAPGSFVPIPPLYLTVAGACTGSLRTFIPHIAHTVLAPPPVPYSTTPSSAYYQSAMEVYNSRNNISANDAALFNNWRDVGGNYHPISHMLRITTDIIVKENMNLEDAATIYAKINMANNDAVVAAFYSKFYYQLQRPVTYIRSVIGAANWLSLPLTPWTPSYPDESSVTASSVAVLENYVGTNYAFIDSAHKSTYGQWSYNSLNGVLEDEVRGRVNGGTIFRFCGVAGMVQGRTVGDMINALPFKKP